MFLVLASFVPTIYAKPSMRFHQKCEYICSLIEQNEMYFNKCPCNSQTHNQVVVNTNCSNMLDYLFSYLFISFHLFDLSSALTNLSHIPREKGNQGLAFFGELGYVFQTKPSILMQLGLTSLAKFPSHVYVQRLYCNYVYMFQLAL